MEVNQNTNDQVDLLNRVATAALWMAIPAGIALGLSIKAFEAVFPPWFFPGGCLAQVLLYIAMLAYVEKRSPEEYLPACVGSMFTFFVPLPLYILLEGGVTEIDWSVIRLFSPFFAFAYPLLVIVVVSRPTTRSEARKCEGKSE